ncbi:MAG: hemerythrin family protein [Nitrospinae bacterium]|nr:hemerythrin family protein [Nitrospinota bacterium]
MYAQWNERYAVGVELLDNQHQRLFALVNELFALIRAGKADREINDFIQKVRDYVDVHFSDEERMMTRAGFPGLEMHRAEHREMLAQVRRYQERAARGDPVNPTSLLEEMVIWLHSHLARSDRAYVEHFKAHGIT